MESREHSFKVYIPNIITILALCSGMTSIRFTLEEKWEAAVLAIIFAMVLDVMDGRIARLLKVVSKFGAELDSLSDLVCFGVAPAFLIYQFSLFPLHKMSWNAVLFYVVCTALRLARFNIISSETKPLWQKHFFVGVPSTAGALIILTPTLWYLGTDIEFFRSAILNFTFLIVIGSLLISRIPFFSFKGIRVHKDKIYIYAILFIMFVALLYSHTFVVLSLVGTGVLFSIFFSYRKYNMTKKILETNKIVELQNEKIKSNRKS